MKFKISKLIIGLILFYLPVDSINGLLVRNIDFSISTIYKSLIMILIAVYLSRLKQIKFLKWLVWVFLLLAIHFIDGSLAGIEFAWAIKFLSIVLSFFFFKTFIESNDPDIIFKITKFSLWVIVLNILIGLAGFGYAQYARDGIGTRGLFFAGNELGVLLLMISLIILSRYLIFNRIKSYLIYSILFIFIAAMLTTKTAVFGQFLIIFSLPFIHFNQTKKNWVINKSSLKLVGFAFVIAFVGLPFLINYVLYDMNLISRISFWSERVGVSTLIFSGRNLRAIEVIEYLQINSSFVNNIFGYGYAVLTGILEGNIAEIDLLDIFMVFGIIGVIGTYGFLFNEFFKKIDARDFIYRPYVRFGILMLIIVSLTSGHVLNSGMAGIMIGMFLSLQYIDFKKFGHGQN